MPSFSADPFVYLASIKRGGASTATPAPTPTPTPTPSAITAVNANGWTAQPVTVPSEFTPDTPGSAVTFDVIRGGYNTAGALTTFTEPNTLTRRRRLDPYSTGSVTDFATKNPSGETAFDRWLFNTDTGAGFGSGSALVAPKPIAGCITPDRLVVRTTPFTIRWVAFTHRARGQRTAPCLEYRIRDAASADSGWLLATWVDQFTDSVDRTSVPGFEATIDPTTIATGAFTVDWRVKPAVGGAASILSTEDVSKPRGVYQLNYTKSATAATILYIASTGNDTTGDGSSGNPYLTAGKALNQMGAAGRDGSTIRVKDSMGWGAVTVTAAGAADAFVTVEKDPATGGAVTLTLPAANITTNCKYIRFAANLTVVRAVSNFFHVTAGGALWIEGTFDCVNSIIALTNVANTRYFLTGGELLNYHPSNFNDVGAIDLVILRGTKYYGAVGNLGIGGLFAIGNDFKGARYLNNLSGRDYSGGILAFNIHNQANGTTGIYNILQPSGVLLNGYAIVSNIFEWVGNAQTPHGIARDPQNSPPTDWSTTNVIIWNNSYAGVGVSGRMNTFYDDNNVTDSSAIPGVVRNHTVVDIRGNVFPQFNIKGGQFVGRVRNDLTNAPLHIGNVALLHGVGFEDNVMIFADAQLGTPNGDANNDFSQLYAGRNTFVGGLTQLTTAAAHPAYATYGGVTLTGATYAAGPGDGSYAVKDTSAPSYQRLSAAILPRTLGGTPRTSPDHAGARGMVN